MPSILQLLDATHPSEQGAFQSQPQQEGIADALRKGFDSGTTSAGASLNQLAGLAGEAAGADEFSKGRYAAAKAGRLRAEAEAPEINSYHQVRDVNTALRYGAGQVGAMAPIAGAAVAGGLITGNPFVGGTLAMAPLAAGDIAERQQEDPAIAGLPAGQKLLRAGVGGLASGAVQNFGPGMFASKLIGKAGAAEAAALAKQSTGSIMARNIAEGVGVNAGGSAGGEAITQYAANPDKAFDAERIKEAGVTGAIMGGPFGVAGGGVEAIGTRARGGVSAIKNVASDIPTKVSSLGDELGEMFQKGRAKADILADKIISGEPLVSAKDFATEAGQQFSDSEAFKAASKWGSEMLDDVGITPERRQAVSDAMQSVSERAGQVAMAGLKKTYDLGKKAAQKIDDLHQDFKTRDVDVQAYEVKNPRIGDGDITDVTPIKKSDDFTGFNKAVTDKLVPFIQETNPDLLNNTKALSQIGNSLRLFMHSAASGDTMRAKILGSRISDIIGPGTQKLLGELHHMAASGDAKKTENYFGALNELARHETSGKSFTDLLRSSLTEEAQGSVLASDIPKLSSKLLAWARGEGPHGMSPAQKAFHDIQIKAGIEEHFGKKAAGVLRALEKETKAAEKVHADERAKLDENGAEELATEGGFDESGRRLEGSKVDSARFGLSKPDINGKSRSQLDGSSMLENSHYGRQHMLDLQATYKNVEGEEPKYNFKFEKLPGSDRGHIVVERNGAASESEFGIGDLERMKLNTHDFSKSPSRLQVDKHNIDAVKVAKIMGEREGYSFEAQDTMPSIHRTADMFKRGIAQLTEQFGKNIDVPDTVVIGYHGGEKFTWGEAQKLRRATAEDRVADQRAQELTEMRKKYAQATWSEERLAKMGLKRVELTPEDLESLREAENQHSKESNRPKNRELSEGDISGPTDNVGRKPRLQGYQQGPRLPVGRGVDSAHNTARDQARTRLEKHHERHLDNIEKKGVPRDQIEARTDMGERPFEERSNGEFGEGGEDGEGSYLTKRGAKSLLEGESRREIGKDEQIHRVEATLGEGDGMINRSNMDGSPQYVGKARDQNINSAIALAHAMRKSETAIGSKLADRLETMLQRKQFSKLSSRDRLALSRLGVGMKASEVAEVINPIARKYKDVISGKPKSEPEPQSKGEKAVNELFNEEYERMGSTADFKQATERLEYLNNPPNDYTTETARSYVVDAQKQAAEVRERLSKMDTDNAAYDKLDDLRFTLDSIVKKGKSVLEGDESLKDIEGTPDPKLQAAKKAALLEAASSSDPKLLKELSTTDDAAALQRTVVELPPGKAADAANKRMGELVQDPQTAYDLTKKYSLESGSGDANAQHEKLITRLADRRADRMRAADAQGKYHRLEGEVSFGPAKNAVTYVAADSATSHTFVVPHELIEKAEQLLASYPADRAPDVLAIVALQHAFYDRKSGDLQSFGPDPRSHAGRLLEQMGALGDTGEKFRHGQAVTRVEGVQARENLNFLADALAYAKHIEGKEKIPVFWERMTGAKKGKKGGGMFNADESGTAKTDSPETRAAVGEYITKVLGKSVGLKFADLTHAGEFERMRLHDIIRLSTTALDPLSTAHHEALHGLFAQLKDANAHDIIGVVEKAAASEHVIAQLNEIYKGNDAVLAQLKDPEERAAYMYQHWANGDLTVGAKSKTVFGKIADFIRSVLGIWSNDERATKILEHFNTGEYANSGNSAPAMSREVMEKGRSQAFEAVKSLAEPLTKLADAVVSTGSGRLRDMDSKAINTIADLVKRDHLDAAGGDRGFIPATGMETRKRMGELATNLSAFSQDHLHEAMEALQKGRSFSGADGAIIRKAQDVIRAHLKEAREYMVKAGVDVGNLGPDYFPRVWDSHYISKHQQEFKDMLEPYIRRGEYKGNADELIRDLAVRDGNEFGIDRQKLDFEEVKSRPPGMQFNKKRVLDFIKPEDAAMFVNKDLMGTLSNYTTQAVRKAEWTRRLGNGKLEALVEQAKAEGATPDQIKQVDTYLRGVDGTLGDGLNPHARRIMGNMIVYQNIRLLPFAAFSSVVDPLGVMVRGGTVKDAWKTFKRGISEIPESFGREGKADEATRIAELTGVVDRAILSSTMGDMYTQGMVGGFAKKANNLFFKYNMMEGLNRSFRIGASEAAVSFIARHADGIAEPHSKRWADELGLQPGDVKKTSDGRIALTEAEGLTGEQVGRVHAAINQWVDGAVLRPDAADKPVWMNDPRYALISHLKQFVYSFQKTIIGRVVHEAEHGNYSPVMALASYVPVMLAADYAKGMIQGGGDQPEWKKGWDMEDYLGYATQRGGLLGVGQFGLDVGKDIHRGGLGLGALTGPTIEQFGDAVQLLGGHKQFGPMVLNALPANALYAHAFGHSDVPEPMFSE